MSEPPPPNGDEGTTPRSAQSGLLEFAAASKAGALPSPPVKLSEELEGIIRVVAETGATSDFPWDALRHLLARKVEFVLGDFWRDAPDLQLQEGESFELTNVEPLRQSLLEPWRDGPPFTVQRLCELLYQPRRIYKSTRKYLYALQRAILVTTTEEASVLAAPEPAQLTTSTAAAAAVAAAAEAAPVAEAAAVADEVAAAVVAAVVASTTVEVAAAAAVGPAAAATEPTSPTASNGNGSSGGVPAGRKRKLPPELSNGVVAE